MRKPWRSASSAERHVESPSSLSRSKPESRSIRGRISNPIPIPGPMDDEFPMRNPGSTMVVQVAEPDSSNSEADVAQRQTTREPTAATPSSASVGDTQVVAQAASREPERAGSAHETTTNETGISIPTHDSSPNGTAANYGGATAINNGNVNVRYSTFSTSTTRETPQHTKPQRKKSTLRGVFSKLFGRKKGAAGRGGGGGGGQVASGLEYGSTPEGSRQHHSDPASWTHPAEEGEGGGEGVDYSPPKRSNSMPLADYGRALRSHAVASRDRLVIESARNSAVLEHSFSKSRRGGSGLELPPPAKYRGLSDESMSGLSPRPASTSARHSRSPEPGQESQDDTGTGAGAAAAADNDDGTPARTTSATNILHRRSQSLSVLQKSQRLGFRRMSSEALRYYWRDSLDADNSDNKSPLGSPRAAESVGERYPDEPPTPVRPFAFDDLEMAGMKITEAVSVTNRVTSLEARSKKLEKVVTKLCMALPPPPHHHAHEKRRSAGMATTTTTTTTTRAKPNVSQTSHHHHHHHHRHSGHPPPPIRRSSVSSDSSFENEAPLPPGYLGLPFASNTGGAGSGAQPAPGRPLSTSTIRGVASLPALSQQELQRPLTYDHYGNLMALVETERSARIALEAQVRDLRRQVQLLSRAAAAGRRDGEGGHSYSEQSAFDYDDDDDDDDDNDEDEDEEKSQPPPSPPPRRRGKAGLVPNDSGLGGSVGGGEEEQQQQRAQAKAAASTDDYDEYSEAYATPYESGGGGVDVGIHDDWGAAVEGSDEEGAARRKAARTMSLSQMTMGSRQQQQQQQQQGSRVA